MTLKVATSQFPMAADVARNLRYVLAHTRDAARRGAHVVHFPECALSGYAGIEFKSFRGFDWQQLEQATREVCAEARRLGIWVMLGSSHRLSGGHKPHNSVYVIDDRGEIVDRYDKMFCAGPREGAEELKYFTPGDHFTDFTIRGVKCGVLICHEYRYPELYREYKRRGVAVVFHSFHAGHVRPAQLRRMQAQVGARNRALNPGSTLPEITVPSTIHGSAANNYLWISCSNTSARESCWPSFMVRPDGVVTGKLRRNVAGVLVSTVDPRKRYYDSTVAWRERAMRGQYHSGTLVSDPRSVARTSL